MAEKKARNKFRDMLGDYYKTNRQISKDESKRDGYKGPLTNREKTMILVVIVLILLLILKSCFLDEVRNLTPEESQFKEYVEYSIKKDLLKGGSDTSPLMMYRIYGIGLTDKDGEAELRYKEPETGKQVDIVQKGRYTAKVRGYFLWVIPVKQISITAPEVATDK